MGQDIEHDAILVHCPLKPDDLTIDLELHFVEMPLAVGLQMTVTQRIGEGFVEFLTPAPDRFMADLDAPLEHHLLNRDS